MTFVQVSDVERHGGEAKISPPEESKKARDTKVRKRRVKLRYLPGEMIDLGGKPSSNIAPKFLSTRVFKPQIDRPPMKLEPPFLRVYNYVPYYRPPRFPRPPHVHPEPTFCVHPMLNPLLLGQPHISADDADIERYDFLTIVCMMK